MRVTVSSLLDLAEQVQASVPLSREPERMLHCDVEFSVTDPDGHEIVLSERLDDEASVLSVKEGKEAGLWSILSLSRASTSE